MSEISRLLDSSDDELALSLLRAADENPPPEAMSKLASALGVGGAFALGGASATALLASKAHAASVATAGAPAATTPWIVAAVAKPLAIGLVGGLTALGGISYVASPRASSTVSASVAAAPAVAHAPRVAARVKPSSVPQAEASDSVAAAVEAQPAEVAAVPRVTLSRPQRAASALPADVAPAAATPVAEPPAPPVVSAPEPVQAPAAAPPIDEALAKELGLLAAARSSLGAGDASAALKALDRYAAERKSGALEPEAAVLRIRTLERLGDRAGAARLARAFLKAHPERSHDLSLRSIAGDAP